MPKLRVFSGAELCDLLIKQGFDRVRQRGSHVIMRRGDRSFPVPLHRQSGLPRLLFE
jgi:predicted RNA binding protein YcfA (HicA-like mRNA interferase family)